MYMLYVIMILQDQLTSSQDILLFIYLMVQTTFSHQISDSILVYVELVHL